MPISPVPPVVRCYIRHLPGLVVLLTSLTLTATATPAPPAAPHESLLGTPVSARAQGAELAYDGCGGETAPVVDATFEQEVVDLVNDERAARGLSPLARSSDLDGAALYHATDMGQDDYFDHNTYDRVNGALQQVCGWASRVTDYYPDWMALGENIAARHTTPQQVMDGWMNSPPHRANILSASFTEIGVGYYAGSGTRNTYWVQDFGARSGGPAPTATPTASGTPTATLTQTPIPSPTTTPTLIPTHTQTATTAPTHTRTATGTPTRTATSTSTPTASSTSTTTTATKTVVASATATQTLSPTPVEGLDYILYLPIMMR